MLKKDGYYFWIKGEIEHLGNYFNTMEFACKCSNEECLAQKISIDLIDKLDWLREASKGPLRINSGYRCAAYQKELADKGINTVVAKKSTHELGDAADVMSSPLSPHELIKYAEIKFKSIGTASNFLHLDLRPAHTDGTPRRWKY